MLLIALLNTLLIISICKGLQNMANELQALQAQVSASDEVMDSAILLINGLADKLDAAQGDPAALAALTEELRSSSSDLAAAVVENTPAEEAPAEEPVA